MSSYVYHNGFYESLVQNGRISERIGRMLDILSHQNGKGEGVSFSQVYQEAAERLGAADGAGKTSGSFQGALSAGELDSIFERASRQYGISKDLLMAVAKAESNFNPQAVSRCGAMGVMQLMPGTAKALGVSDAFDPEENIMGGAKYLSQMLSRYDGNVELSLAAYNAGSGNVQKYGGVPPFEETRGYIDRVMGYLNSSSQGALTDTLTDRASSDYVSTMFLLGLQGLQSQSQSQLGWLDTEDETLI